MNYNSMPYSRPDMDRLKCVIDDFVVHFKAAKTFDEADRLLSDIHETLDNDYDTNFSLATVRYYVNTNDEFYSKENDFADEMMPVMQDYVQKILIELINTPFHTEFANKYGNVLFKNIENMLKSSSPETVSDVQEDNKLISEYDKLIASAQIPFEGKTYTVSQLAPFKEDADDERRRLAWLAEGKFFMDNAQQLDRCFDDLVKVRDNNAKKMGYKNFIELGYYRMNRNCYTPADIDKFRAAVVKNIVPLADKLYREQAERIGVKYPLSYANKALVFRSGNPKPKGTSDDILAAANKMYHDMSPETSEFIDFMYENGLFDVLSRTGKIGGGFATGFAKYKAPFIFANFNGTQHDVEVMTHEAGHAFAFYTAFKNNLPSLILSPSMETCEVHSMSMEFFAWKYAEDFFGADTDKFYYNHLAGAITFIPYGTMVDHFQHIIYEKPELTPAERHDVWRKLHAIYMPYVALDDGIPFYSEGRAWQRQSHIYQNPFYYIDYCLAQTVALEFWALMQHDRADAWKRYIKFVSLSGPQTFTELVSAVGLETPFGDTALKTIADEAVARLSAQDKTKLV